jgi:hypothetical protein
MKPEANAVQIESLTTITEAFSGQIKPVRSSVPYALAMLMVTLVMVLLPLVYVGIVVATGWVVYWHATHNVVILQNAKGAGAIKVAALLYIAPILAGFIGVLFMIKPLFAPRGKHPEPYTIERGEEPTLHAYVGTLCQVMGAPVPKRIDVTCEVNASASLRAGFLSLLGNDLVLTIGLPLAAGLTLRELTCIMAHEFGHFTQGWAMRLGYIVARINRWFARVAFERDAWDEQLEEWRADSGHVAAWVVVAVASLFVWFSRLILKVLMYTGAAVSSILSRQQEYNADAWSSRVVGSEAAAGLFQRMRVLALSEQPVMNEVAGRWSSRQLPDNLVSLYVSARDAIPGEVRQALDRAFDKEKTGIFDSHPADRERVASLRKIGDAGVLRVDGPATMLFRNFDEVCRKASYLHYKLLIGEAIFETTLVPTASIIQQADKRRDQRAAAAAYLGGIISPLVPLGVNLHDSNTRDAVSILRELRGARSLLAARLAETAHAVRTLETADDRLDAITAADTVREIGLVVVPSRFELPDNAPATLAKERSAAESKAIGARGTVEAVAPMVVSRLQAALLVLRLPEAGARVANIEDRLGRLDRSLMMLPPAVEALGRVWPCHRLAVCALEVLRAGSARADQERAIVRLRALARDVLQRVQAARGILAGLRVPSPDGNGPDTPALSMEALPSIDNLSAVFEVGTQSANELRSLYEQLLCQLVDHALAAEDALQLPRIELSGSK